MFETTGSLAIVQPVLTLIALVGLPFLWTLVAALSARKGDDVLAPVVALTGSVATLGLTIVLGVRLALLPRGYLLVQHVAQLGRLGQLDLAFDLVVDPRSVVIAAIIALIACASSLHTAWSGRPDTTSTLGWTGLVTTGAMLLCTGDGFAPILIGLGMLSLGSWGLSRGGDIGPNVAATAGNVSILLGLVFLFWSLGGSFGPEGYDPDGAPRFVLVATTEPPTTEPKATLSMTTHAGALVSSDDADLPGEPIASPFSVLVPPGLYTLRVQSGVASGDVVVPRVALVAGRSHILTPYGPTASLRVLGDQIAVPRLAPNGATAGVRQSLGGRTIAGVRASIVVLLLLLGGALAHVHSLANRRGRSAIASMMEVVPAAYLALRFAPLVDPTALEGAMLAGIGATSALVLAANAASVDDAHKALRSVLAAAVSTGLAAIGFGESSGALVVVSGAIVSGSAALAAIEARRDPRWLGVACASAVGLLPGAGASTGFIFASAAALGSAVTGSVVWAIFAAFIAAAIIGTTLLSSLAAFRVYDAVIRASTREPGVSRGQGAVVIILTVVGLVGGTALGAGTTAFGGGVVPLARRLVGPSIQVPKSIAAASVLLSLIAAAGGVVLARRVSAQIAPPSWLVSLGRPYALIGAGASRIAGAFGFLHRAVRTMDRDVVDDVPTAFRDVVVRITRLGGSGSNEAEEASDFVSTLILVAMVALLGLVVLSLFLLR